MALRPPGRPPDLHLLGTSAAGAGDGRAGRTWIPILPILVAGLIPGALAGGQLAALLFFLNPGLPFAPGPVLRAVLLYSSELAGASLLASLPWTWGRARRAGRAWRSLPWALLAVFTAAAGLDWTHASYYAYFLPSGINERLIKTALWLSLAALVTFYTALLHSLNRRPYGRRSRWGLALLAVLSLFVAGERRSSFKPSPAPLRRPGTASASEAGQRPRLLVVGLAGATLDAILPLAGDGRLPFFATLLQEGAYGRLESLTPHRPDALWTTLASGKFPSKHGVLGAAVWPADLLAPGAQLRLLPLGIGFERWGIPGVRRSPAASARTAATLWEVLSRSGVPTGPVGWPAVGPPAGSSVGSLVGSLGSPPGLPFAVTAGFFAGGPGDRTALPPALAERAHLLRVGPREVDPALIARFGPAGASPGLSRDLAADLWREAVALDALGESPGSLFLELPGLEEASGRWFGGFSVVEFEGAKARLYREAAQAVTAYYQHLDEFLAALWKAGEGPRILVVVSPYGMEGPGRWRRLSGEMSRRTAVGGRAESSPDGVVLLYGEGIRRASLLTGAQLVDVAPTLLYGMGFPVARDMDGKVLTAAFDRGLLAERPLTFVSSHEPAPAGAGPP